MSAHDSDGTPATVVHTGVIRDARGLLEVLAATQSPLSEGINALLADAELGRRVRENNRRNGKRKREDFGFVEAVLALRRKAPRLPAYDMASRLLSDWGNRESEVAHTRLTRRIQRVLQRERQRRANCPRGL